MTAADSIGYVKPMEERLSRLEAHVFRTSDDLVDVKLTLVDVTTALAGLTTAVTGLTTVVNETRQDVAGLKVAMEETREDVADLRSGLNVVLGEVDGLKAWREELSPRVAKLVARSEGIELAS